MEETTSWKAHGFTFFIFGGIIVLCSIFFVLGMLVGRGQGRKIAEIALAEESAPTAAAEAGAEEYKFNFYSETTRDNPESAPERARVEPPPPPSPPPAPPSARRTEPSPAVPASTPSASTKYLQILATSNRKQADAYLNKVKSSGFQAMITPKKDEKNVELYRVWVGPYSEKEVDLAKADLEAKGYKGAFVAK